MRIVHPAYVALLGVGGNRQLYERLEKNQENQTPGASSGAKL